MRSSGFFESISGLGRQYGPSSIRFPNFRQSSNLRHINDDQVTLQRDVPMRQNNLAFHVLVERHLNLLRLLRQGHNMRNHLRDTARVQAAHGENPTDDGVGISSRNICAADHKTRKEESRIRTVLPGISEAAFCQRCENPVGLDDRYESFFYPVIIWEVGGYRDDVGDIIKRLDFFVRRTPRLLCSAILRKKLRELEQMLETSG